VCGVVLCVELCCVWSCVVCGVVRCVWSSVVCGVVLCVEFVAKVLIVMLLLS